MKFRLLIVLSLLSLTACPQAGSLFTPGSFEANKTTSGGEKSKEGSDDTASVDRIVSTDVPPPGSPPPPGTSPEAAGNPPPTGGDSGQNSASEGQMMMAFRGPIDPKNDGDGVGSGQPLGMGCSAGGSVHCLLYGPKFETVANGFSGSEPFLLGQNGSFSLDFLLKELTASKDDKGETRFGWVAEPDGPQVRIVYRPAGKWNWEAAKFCDVKIAHVDGGSNLSFTDLSAGPGTVVFYLFKRLTPPTLPEWMLAGLPASEPSYETTGDFHPCDLVPFADAAEYDNITVSFIQVGRLELDKPPVFNGAIRSIPQSAP
jgi:predicted small lipoprotein YifL